jgi:hypothetical protein
MADAYQLEATTDRYLLEDGTGVYLLENIIAAVEEEQENLCLMGVG